MNAFPWHRPTEDRRAGRVEALASGPGSSDTSKRGPSLAAGIAFVVGVLAPAAWLVFSVAAGFPPWALVAIPVAAAAAVALAVGNRRATRRRAAARAVERAAGRALRETAD